MVSKAPLLLLAAFLAVITGFNKPAHKDKWRVLFNGKNLSGWDTYLGPGYDATGKRLPALGLNNDPNHVFSVVDDNGEKVIHISGEGFGAITSKDEFENYHVQLMFKWGKNTWGPKKGKPKDSGLLYYCTGPDGADYGNWMRSQEFQVEQGNVGDYWGVAGGFEEIPAKKLNDSEYVYTPGAAMVTFRDKTAVGRHCIKKGDAEKPEGEWNTIDLFCHGDTSVQVVNGKVMMILYKSQQWDNGVASPLIKGKLQIQSEGAEVYYKNIRIEHINQIPTNLLQ
ncbi:MAG TPA: DUF1080 domain-containing protein [Chitinophagaceae bacterium]|nr:DUF1080 domain-containing protein [Chitinophagaceae bacterium]